MPKFRHFPIVMGMLLLLAAPSSQAQLSIRLATPNLSIGINLPAYPHLVLIPGYPVYYTPGLQVNYFFYDGYYWVFQDGNWYASSWYNGPWAYVEPLYVPVFILRIPVRYYPHPPAFFHGWRQDAPPHWGEHWGHSWEQHRSGWDHWDRRAAPPPAPLPEYQQRYPRDLYPHQLERQRQLEQRYYQPPPPTRPVPQYQRGEPPGAPSPRNMPQQPNRYPQGDRSGSPQAPQRQYQPPGRQGGGSEYRREQPGHESGGGRGPQRGDDLWWYKQRQQQ